MQEIMIGISMFLRSAWRFFSEIDVPGIGISVGTLFIGVFLVHFSIKFIFVLLGHTTFGSGGDKDDK